MPKVILGKPEDDEQPKDDHEVSFWIHDNLYCTLDYKEDGVYVDGWGKDGGHVFGPKHFPNDVDAHKFIDAKREFLGKGDSDDPKSKSDSGTRKSQ